MDNNLLKTMYKLRNKAEEYWASHNNETRISYEGAYRKPNIGCAVILINGLSEDDLSTLRKIGCMSRDEFFDMHVKE